MVPAVCNVKRVSEQRAQGQEALLHSSRASGQRDDQRATTEPSSGSTQIRTRMGPSGDRAEGFAETWQGAIARVAQSFGSDIAGREAGAAREKNKIALGSERTNQGRNLRALVCDHSLSHEAPLLRVDKGTEQRSRFVCAFALRHAIAHRHHRHAATGERALGHWLGLTRLSPQIVPALPAAFLREPDVVDDERRVVRLEHVVER